MSTHARLLGSLCAGALSLAPLATHAAKPSDAVDVSGARDKLRIFTDGKKHFIALVPFEYTGPLFFYGDGKAFYGQRSFGGGRNGDDTFNRSFWDPRMNSGTEAMFQLRDKKYTLSCAHRVTTFTPLPDADNRAIIDSASFHRPRWKFQSYWLAHDDQNRYYYVDRAREPEGNKNFRVFVGPKGNLKQLKVTKVVSSAKGDIFTTKAGQLRLVVSAAEGEWIHGKSRLQLTSAPIEDNHVLVYTDLGVYTGERLGTPCDDL